MKIFTQRMLFAIAVSVVLSFVWSSQSDQASAKKLRDVSGSRDHPLAGRYEGSYIEFFQSRAYSEIYLPSKAASHGIADVKQFALEVKGKTTEILYSGPAERSSIEIVRNFQTSLEKNGFAIEYYCKRDDCGAVHFKRFARGGTPLPASLDKGIYTLMKLDKAGARIWISVYSVEIGATAQHPMTPFTVIRVVEEKGIELDKIEIVDSNKIASAINDQGRVALYGIEFDFDSDRVKPSSDDQVSEIAKFLREQRGISILVVGHTDSIGGIQYNNELSGRRAEAVVQLLVRTHGIASERLFPVGVGAAAPVATNRTEYGRARNRRVEIVELVSSKQEK